MKYRDSEGNLQEIYLPPTGDTLPIGSVIEYAGDTVPTNWELVEDTGTYKRIKKVANSVGLVANVTNEYSESTQDSYGCAYINNIVKENIYSTEEKQIGKWIDNKPLYRKTFVINGNSSTGQQNYQFELASLNWETVTFIYGTTYQETNSYYRDLHNAYAYDSTATSEYSGAWTSGTLLRVRSRGIAVSKFYVTLEYTKTTDSPSN